MKNGGGMSIDRPRATILGLQKVYAHKHKARGYLKAVGGPENEHTLIAANP